MTIPATEPLASLEARLQQLEDSHIKLATQHEQIVVENEKLRAQIETMTLSMTESSNELKGEANGRGPSGSGRRSRWGFDDQPEDIRTDQPESSEAEEGTAGTFAEGFKWTTDDGELTLRSIMKRSLIFGPTSNPTPSR